MHTSIKQGIDVLLEKNTQKGLRLGLVTNHAAFAGTGTPSRVALLHAGFNLVKLYSPEHGMAASLPDGEKVEDQADALTGLPVISLYGKRLKPSPENLLGLDAVLFDIPDVGARFYTYLWTLSYVMEACAEAGIPLQVLDRPNPMGGNLEQSEGPMLDETNCSSFIGRWNLPVTHCCTLGELALFFRATRVQKLDLEVVPCLGWDRKKSFLEANLPFTPTSPAIKTAETALLYPGTGLFEGININEGRGTEYPFKQAGAPWINTTAWQNAMENEPIPGVITYPVRYKPEWGLYAGEVCHGLHFSITDPASFRPVAFGLQLIRLLLQTHPGSVMERLYPTVANPSGKNHLDRLIGISNSFSQLKNGILPDINIRAAWKKMVEPYLLY